MSRVLLIGESRPEPDTLELMRTRGGKWAAYQNHDLGHPDLGHLKFLQHGGPGNTFPEPPRPRLPDTPKEMNWRYLYVGEVDLTTGEITEAGSNAGLDQV